MSSNNISLDEFKTIISEQEKLFAIDMAKLTELCRCLVRSPDFSGSTLLALDEYIAASKDTNARAKKLRSVLVRRGRTFLTEKAIAQKEKIKEECLALNNGTLRINRRDKEED